MIQRTFVKDPTGPNASYQQTLAEIDVSKDEKKRPAMKPNSDEAVHENEQAEAGTEKALKYELQKKDGEIWKLNKRIEDLEKDSLYPAVVKERASENAQIREANSSEKYENEIEDIKAREQNYARNAAILAKELKQEKLRHAKTLKKLHETEQKLQNELNRKDDEIIQQLKTEDLEQVELATAVADEEIMLMVSASDSAKSHQLKKSEDLEQVELATATADEEIMLMVSASDSAKSQQPKKSGDLEQVELVSASDSAESQDRRDKIKKIQRYIDKLESSRVELIRQCQEAKDLIKKCCASNIPELIRGPELKSDGLVELDLALKLTKCHEIFICPLEVGSEQLIDHLASKGYMITRVCKIPGQKIHVDLPEDDMVRHEKYIPPHRRVKVVSKPPLSKMNMFGKFVIGGITECVFRLHRLGLCLNGNFSLQSFHYTATSNKIKLDADVKSSACHRTMQGMDLDYFTIHDTIIHILSICQHGTPFDLRCLLDLLCSQYPSEKQIIIRYNASLMDEIQKRNHFIIMYDRFKQIAQEDGVNTTRVEKVLKFIKPDTGWQTRLYDNEFTEMVSLRHLVDSYKRPRGNMDLLDIWRHNFTHLHETSTELSDEDEVDIMDNISEGVINQLQEGMHSIRVLRCEM